ncbi:MAG: hypothetical protein FWD83_09250 [Promicromonosporaceae bacterium]|nr:hypothetical protein [Promicromonosporaceae bacterium]
MNDGTGLIIARESDRGRLQSAHRRGEVERLRWGGYRLVLASADGPEYRSDEVARMMLVDRQLKADHVFSHKSAALIWGLPRWTPEPRIQVIQQYRSSRGTHLDLRRHFMYLHEDEKAQVHGLPVTELRRTVLDCAVTLHPLESLVIADRALTSGLTAAELLVALEARGAIRGRRLARLVMALADGGAASPWETWLRYIAHRAGLPRPTTQFAVQTRLGQRYLDLAWPEYGVFAEFDGRVKYCDGAFGPGYDADQARFEEKRRADAVEEATGRSLLRITAADRPAEVAHRLTERFPPHLQSRLRPNPLLPPIP